MRVSINGECIANCPPDVPWPLIGGILVLLLIGLLVWWTIAGARAEDAALEQNMPDAFKQLRTTVSTLPTSAPLTRAQMNTLISAAGRRRFFPAMFPPLTLTPRQANPPTVTSAQLRSVFPWYEVDKTGTIRPAEPVVKAEDLDVTTEPVRGWKIMTLPGLTQISDPLLKGGFEMWPAAGKLAWCGTERPADNCLLDPLWDRGSHAASDGKHCGIHIIKEKPLAASNAIVEVSGSGIVIEGSEGVWRVTQAAVTRIHLMVNEIGPWQRTLAEYLSNYYQVPCELELREEWNDAVRRARWEATEDQGASAGAYVTPWTVTTIPANTSVSIPIYYTDISTG